MKRHDQTVRFAGTEEAGEALAILQEAALWSARFGAPIWPVGEFTLANEEAFAAAGELVGAFELGRMVACMRLQSEDRIVWPGDSPGEALYVHKVALTRSHAGQGLVEHLVEFAINRARELEIPFVRLDTLPRPRMVSLYEGFGFTLVDAEPGEFGGRILVRLERRA